MGLLRYQALFSWKTNCAGFILLNFGAVFLERIIKGGASSNKKTKLKYHEKTQAQAPWAVAIKKATSQAQPIAIGIKMPQYHERTYVSNPFLMCLYPTGLLEGGQWCIL